MTKWLTPMAIALLLSACASHKPRTENTNAPASSSTRNAPESRETSRPQAERYRQEHDDGPAAPAVDVSKLVEPVPKLEPRARYGNSPSYSVLGQNYRLLPDGHGYVERGIASWYGNKFHGYMTSSLEPYDMYAFSAAHKTLPLPTYARVTNLDNGKSVVVRINDRGPFHENRLIDLSYAAAVRIGIWPKGTGLVEVRALDPAHPEAAPPPPMPKTVTAQADTHIYLQLGAFGDRANAERVADAARRGGIDHVDIESAGVNGHTVHRVRVGPLADVAAADALTPRIEKLGFGAPRVAIER
ncbi:MAG TPA: septal ring lytic transglycosylase RlpA family protein [Rhodanobacteraceae bacterium]|jgi:rare lipoprotein A|nr:septal ring lytic transglycosylase RlpA family protein [Rhodanobacteraceae bacterium]